jgi:hypothetical protein
MNQLRVYRFGTWASYGGDLVAALERLQAEGEGQLLDALYVRRDADSGALEAVDRRSGRADASFSVFLDFRPDEGRRKSTTERTLSDPEGVPPALIEAIGDTLEPGAAIFAILYAGSGEGRMLDEAVERVGGSSIVRDQVEVGALGELDAQLRAAASEAAP